MKIGILITARAGSKRLKEKHFLEVKGRPILAYLIARISKEFEQEITCKNVEIIIATSCEPENMKFEHFNEYGISVSYGSAHNIPLRHLEAARLRSLDSVISVDGDDILCSSMGMRKIFDNLSTGAEFVKTVGLPFGMNSLGYSTNFLDMSLANNKNSVLETGWGRIFNNSCVKEIPFKSFKDNDLLRFTLDYKEDYDFFKRLIEIAGENIATITDEEIVKIVIDCELFRINQSIIEEYWNNFNKVLSKEKHKE